MLNPCWKVPPAPSGTTKFSVSRRPPSCILLHQGGDSDLRSCVQAPQSELRTPMFKTRDDDVGVVDEVQALIFARDEREFGEVKGPPVWELVASEEC
jgi:hypothetical protein